MEEKNKTSVINYYYDDINNLKNRILNLRKYCHEMWIESVKKNDFKIARIYMIIEDKFLEDL